MALVQCSDDEAASPTVVLYRNVAAPTCPTPEEAPLPDGNMGFTCLRVGADTAAAASSVPDMTGLPAPVVYVREAATGGDGSLERPFGAVDAALARVAMGGTIALLRGTVTLDAPATLPSGVALIGVGPVGSAIDVTRGHGGLAVAPGASGVVVRDLAVRYRPGTATAPDAAITVGDGAVASIQNVRVDGAFEGIVVDGTLDAERVSVLRAAANGVVVQGNGAGRFRSLLVREGLGQGVAARPRVMGGPAGRIHITGGAILDHRGRGIELTGAAATGRGARSCTLDGPSSDAGDVDCLARVSSQRNGVQALIVRGARGVEVRRSSLSATHINEGALDADGLAMTEGAQVSIDPEDRSMARLGRGTLVLANARMGVLAQGGGVTLTLRGARVQSNASVGVWVARGALARAVSYARIDDNGAAGVAVTATASIEEVQCNGIASTRARTIMTLTGESPMIGDGLTVANAAGDLRVDDNQFDHNARAGAVFDRVAGQFTRNRGDGNQYGLSVVRSDTLVERMNERLRGTVADRTDRLTAVTSSP